MKGDFEYQEKQRTLLHISVICGNAIATFFLANNKGFLIDAKDREGKTALHYATELRFGACGRVLLKAGANPNVCDDDGITPLDVANRRSPTLFLSLFEFFNTSLPAFSKDQQEIHIQRRKQLVSKRRDSISVPNLKQKLVTMESALIMRGKKNKKNKLLVKARKQMFNKQEFSVEKSSGMIMETESRESPKTLEEYSYMKEDSGEFSDESLRSEETTLMERPVTTNKRASQLVVLKSLGKTRMRERANTEMNLSAEFAQVDKK